MHKTNLAGLTRNALRSLLVDLGEKPYRAGQIWSWLYQKGVTDFDDMTNLSKSFRQRLRDHAVIESMDLKTRTESVSGTRKYLWMLDDGQAIESVFIPEGRRRTICISSQAGCPLACAFCATGRLGLIRNLSVFEIVDQVLAVRRQEQCQPTNMVVMGMGEPFLNYDHVMQAMAIINDHEGIAIGHRKITISTAGIVPRIRQYTEEGHPYKLAVSLNATTDSLRSRLMPVNRTYPLETLLDAVRDYTRRSKKRVTFEYVLLAGVNDSDGDARRLMKLLHDIPCKVNLIAYNKTSGRFQGPDAERISAFAGKIRPLSAPVTLRLSKGDDINGACGQLAGR